MLSQNALYYGKEDLLPEQIRLRAGPLSLIYEQGDLRYIKLGDREVLRRVYVAIRDHNWVTILPGFTNVQMEIADDSFHIVYDVENKQGAIDFAWKGAIMGDPLGTITFTMDGLARSTFMRNRIGFCILHPAACAGAACIVEHVNGRLEQAQLPTFIVADQPVQPFGEMQALAHEVVPGAWAKLRFSGDIFEMEDQRNWTVASYKTFCTPLRLPYPVEVKRGARITQSVTLVIEDKRPAISFQGMEPPQSGASSLTFTLDTSASPKPVPLLGLGVASHGQPLSALELARLKALHLHHLRVDLLLSDPGFIARLRLASAEASALGVPLEGALLLSDDAGEELQHLVEVLNQIRPEVTLWLIYPVKELFQGGSRTREVVALARKRLIHYNPESRFGAGTNTDFIFMQRTPPPVELLDVISFAVNPQVHAFDNASLVETLEAQAALVATARRRAVSLPVIVSPVTLKPRFNPYATGPLPGSPPGQLPPQVDVRQMSLFGAGWTAGSLKRLAESGVVQATYYETTGWRGVMETESGSSLPGVFRSLPGCVFPIYHVFADLGEYAGGQVIPTLSSDSLRVDGLALKSNGRTRLILANYTPDRQHILLKGVARQARVKSLDENSAAGALCTPEAFRSRPGQPVQAPHGSLELDLLTFAVVTIDAEE